MKSPVMGGLEMRNMDYKLRYFIHMSIFLIVLSAISFVFAIALDIKRNRTLDISFRNLAITDFRLVIIAALGICFFLIIMSLIIIPLTVRPDVVEIKVNSVKEHQDLLIKIVNIFESKSKRHRINTNGDIQYVMNNKYLDWLIVPVNISTKGDTVIISAPIYYIKEIN